MSFTNKTANYDLPQWVAADKPTFLQDLNGAFSDIDAQMKTNETAAASAQSTADVNTSSITSLGETVTSQGTRLTAVEASASASAGNINTINSLIGNGEPTTSDKTLIGAINELDAGKASNADLSGKVDKGDILKYTGTHTFTVNGDGTKTLKQLMDELYTDLKTYIQAKGSAYRFNVCKQYFNNDYSGDDMLSDVELKTNGFNSVFRVNAMRISGAGSSVFIYKGYFYSSSNVVAYDVANSSYSDISSNVPASTSKTSITIAEYELV